MGCDHDCVYGWCKRIFSVKHTPRLVGDPGHVFRVRDAYVFLNSAHDAYSSIIPSDWISLQHEFIGNQHPSNKWLVQTKNTPRFFDFIEELELIKDRVVLATTLETNRVDGYDWFSKAVAPDVRWRDLGALRRMGFTVMASLEPIMDFDATIFANILINLGPKYVELGPDNYKCGLPEPTGDKIDILVAFLEQSGIEVIRKDGLERFY